MDKTLTKLGILSAFIWLLITVITFGIPLSIAQDLDNAFGNRFSDQVLDLANGFHYDVNNNDMPTVIFLILFTLAFWVMFYAIIRLRKTAPTRKSLRIIIGFAILFRIILLPGQLIHENDVYRYLWDGKVFKNGINPYKYAPGDLMMYEKNYKEDYYDEHSNVTFKARYFNLEDKKELDQLIDLREEQPVYFSRIGHAQVSTIYPPFVQSIFAFAATMKQDSIILMKLIFVLFDIGVIFIVVGLLKHFKLDRRQCLIYAWSPLVLKEIANAGHYDSVAVFFAMLSVFLAIKRLPAGFSVSLALSTLSKFFAAIFMPILRKLYRFHHFLLFLFVVVLFYLPFVFMDQTGMPQVFAGMSVYQQEWAYNASIFAGIRSLLFEFKPDWTQTLLPAKYIVAGLYGLIMLGLMFGRKKSPLRLVHKCFVAIAALFILNPVGDPWYFCWVIPFLCLFPYRSWILLSGLLMFSYLNFHSDFSFLNLQFFHIPILSGLIYSPFFVYLLVESIFKGKGLISRECPLEPLVEDDPPFVRHT